MSSEANKYYIVHKPFRMLSQFIGGAPEAKLLSHLNFDFPEGIHAIGRLDNESEGLLILTTDKRITKLLFSSAKPHSRTYLVKVDRIVQPETLDILRNGISIRIRGGEFWTTSPCEVDFCEEPLNLPEVPERLAFHSKTTWLKVTLKEGKYHQVRKMVAAVGHKCKRLIRVSIDQLELDGLKSGEVREIDEKTFFEVLGLG